MIRPAPCPGSGEPSPTSEQNRIELESQDSFTDRFAPVQSISGSTITMQQPAWNNNNWGYDTLAGPFAGGALQLENSNAFLRTAGQWYPRAGQLYYKTAAGQGPAHSDIELPRLTSLLQISGSYTRPVRDITFQGLAFTHTTWLRPGTSIGYANQQNGTFIAGAYPQPADFITSCRSGCKQFEATRNEWHQIPAAVQVSAASGITFSQNTFTDLGRAHAAPGRGRPVRPQPALTKEPAAGRRPVPAPGSPGSTGVACRRPVSPTRSTPSCGGR